MWLEDLDVMIATLKIKRKHITILAKHKRSNFPIIVLNPQFLNEMINIS